MEESASDRTWFRIVSLVLLVLSLAPGLCAVAGKPRDLHFTGALFFEQDDHMVLSVMEEGRAGRWAHEPPYVVPGGRPAFFYLPYLAVGHLARVTGVDLRIGFQVARIVAGAALLWALWGFVSRRFADRGERRFAFLLAATGSGLGWLRLSATGVTNMDLFATEMFPGFSILVSAHLALSLAAMLWLLDALVAEGGPRARWPALVAGSLILATSQPFALVIVLALAAMELANEWKARRPGMTGIVVRIAAAALIAAPFVVHEAMNIRANPAFSGWRDQLHTLTPGAVELLIAAGLALPFAALGAVAAWRAARRDLVLLGVWLILAIVLMQVPWYQQRRFDVGAWIPLALLAVYGTTTLRFARARGFRMLFVAAASLTHVLLLASMCGAMAGRDPSTFASESEWRALAALDSLARPREVLLASPLLSRMALTRAPLRVVYGNPVETPDAVAQHERVLAFYRGTLANPDSLLRPVQWILVGPRERAIGTPQIPPSFARVWSADGVTLWGRVRSDPAAGP